MEIFIGIDPSLNSSGVCILKYFDDDFKSDNFYCIKPNKLSKREIKEDEMYLNFDYILYEKTDLTIYTENIDHEFYKTQNIINIGNTIYNLIVDSCDIYNDNIYIVMEGISYGSSIRTSSIYDLAGLNYILRYKLQNKGNIKLIVASPKQIKKYATGNGNAKKDELINIFKALYKFDIKKIDDISDSYFMAKYAKYIYEIDNKKGTN